MLLGAVNAFNDQVGQGKNILNDKVWNLFHKLLDNTKKRSNEMGNYWR